MALVSQSSTSLNSTTVYRWHLVSKGTVLRRFKAANEWTGFYFDSTAQTNPLKRQMGYVVCDLCKPSPPTPLPSPFTLPVPLSWTSSCLLILDWWTSASLTPMGPSNRQNIKWSRKLTHMQPFIRWHVLCSTSISSGAYFFGPSPASVRFLQSRLSEGFGW